MKHTAIFIAAALLALPAAAQAQSNTASGSFTFTLNPTLPPGDQVQVVGLDDVNFGTINLGPYGSDPVPVAPKTMHFCLNRTTPGDVILTINQLTNPAEDDQFRMSGAVPDSDLYFGIHLNWPNGFRQEYLARGFPYTVNASAPGCTATNDGAGIGHSLELAPTGVNTAFPSGTLSTTIQIIIAPAG